MSDVLECGIVSTMGRVFSTKPYQGLKQGLWYLTPLFAF